MSLWIKICANTSLADAMIAAEAGTDAVGFVFAPSPRRVTAEQAAAIVAGLPAKIDKIGVFVDATVDEIAATVEAARLTGVQLHWETPIQLRPKLRARFGKGCESLRVVHFEAVTQGGALRRHAVNMDADALLVDSRTAAAVGGTGQTYDWEMARQTIFQTSGQTKLIAAGGLTPENVVEAIALLHPWGVDVVSGVEVAPGRKDATKVRAFIANARAAAKAR